MKIQLVGIYSDGSNALSLEDSVIFEREYGTIGSEEMEEFLTAQEAVSNAQSHYSRTIIVLRPDIESAE